MLANPSLLNCPLVNQTRVTVLAVKCNQVRLGTDAPD